MCYTQSMEQLWTLLLLGRVWGRHAPTRSLRKLARVWEAKSRMNRKFSRIENLWPRDGSCPLSLRSKHISGNCFRIVKTKKQVKGSCSYIESPVDPNEVPAPVCAAALTKSRYHVRTAHEIFKVQSSPEKKNTAQAAQRWILSGWIGGKMNRVCCGAVNLRRK